MNSRLEEQIRSYSEVLFSHSPPVENLMPDQLMEEGASPAGAIDIIVDRKPRVRRSSRTWLYALASAAAVLVLAMPLWLWSGSESDVGQDPGNTPPGTSVPNVPTTKSVGVIQYEWHRMTDPTEGGAHSVLTCSWGTEDVECVFDEEPAPGGRKTVGEFSGEVVSRAECLAHMTEPCTNAVAIAQGTQYYDNDGGVDFVIQATIAVQPDGTMIHSFDSGRPAAPFHCLFFPLSTPRNEARAECIWP